MQYCLLLGEVRFELFECDVILIFYFLFSVNSNSLKANGLLQNSKQVEFNQKLQNDEPLPIYLHDFQFNWVHSIAGCFYRPVSLIRSFLDKVGKKKYTEGMSCIPEQKGSFYQKASESM